MEFSLKNELSYKPTIIKLSVYTTLSVVGCMLWGYFFLPLAAAYYGALLTFESRGKRVMSYVIPSVLFTLNFFVRAAFSLEAISYVILGLVIYYAVKKGISKSETVVWMTIITIALLVCSAILIAFEKTGNIGYLPLKQFYSNFYINVKELFISDLTSRYHINSNGNPVFLFNSYKAMSIFNDILISSIGIAVILSFAIVGFTLKIYQRFVTKCIKEHSTFSEWRFGASTIVCLFYIIVIVVNFFISNDGSVFAITFMTLNLIFEFIFFYLGCRSIYNFFASKGRKIFAIIMLVVACVIFTPHIFSVLSYFGVVVTIINNRKSVVSE